MTIIEKQQKASELKNQIREKQAQIEDLLKIANSKLSSVEIQMDSLKNSLVLQILRNK
jgi:hypothetical protein